jgi:hypothetical protein
MARFHHYAGAGVGIRHSDEPKPSKNHFASVKLTKQAAAQIQEMGLVRVAGNVFASNAFELQSTKDFWKVGEDGNITRLTGGEVDLHESIAGAPKDEPADFLQGILADLEL